LPAHDRALTSSSHLHYKRESAHCQACVQAIDNIVSFRPHNEPRFAAQAGGTLAAHHHLQGPHFAFEPAHASRPCLSRSAGTQHHLFHCSYLEMVLEQDSFGRVRPYVPSTKSKEATDASSAYAYLIESKTRSASRAIVRNGVDARRRFAEMCREHLSNMLRHQRSAITQHSASALPHPSAPLKEDDLGRNARDGPCFAPMKCRSSN
jgi:hypothetical protein